MILCTASDVSSIPSMSTSGGGGGSRRGVNPASLYANESLLGTRPEDSFTTDEDSLGFGGGGGGLAASECNVCRAVSSGFITS